MSGEVLSQDEVENFLNMMSSMMSSNGTVSQKREFVSEHQFSTALLNCDTDLENLTQRIVAFKGVNFSLCLYGVPGSGKSVYARYLRSNLK